jgi:hypothetical protein
VLLQLRDADQQFNMYDGEFVSYQHFFTFRVGHPTALAVVVAALLQEYPNASLT